MRKLINVIKSFAFWGIMFLLILVLGFGIRLKDIFEIAMSFQMPLAAFCIYFLISIVLYPLLAVLTNIKAGLSFIDIFVIHFPTYLWIPYKGLDIRGLFKLKEYGSETRAKVYDIWVHIYRFFDTVIWWALVVGGTVAILNSSNNGLINAIDAKTTTQKLSIIGIVVGIYFLLLIISLIIWKAVTKRWRNGGIREPVNKGTKAQQYFDRHPEKIPSECRACGGPYPECRSSCNLFDE